MAAPVGEGVVTWWLDPKVCDIACACGGMGAALLDGTHAVTGPFRMSGLTKHQCCVLVRV
jgi:hypothetical protein